MNNRKIILVAVLVVLSTPPAGSADEKPEEIVRRIVASWRTRQAKVQTLSCTARVDSFYVKGYLTGLKLPEGMKPLPEKDSQFKGEPASWDIDFVNQRFRNEHELTTAYSDPEQNLYALRPWYVLGLSTNGKSSDWYRKNSPTKKKQPDDVFHTDVALYESADNMGVVGLGELPLLWIAGGISGRYPSVTEMKHLEAPTRLLYRGEAQREGRACFVLTAPEQLSPTAVREFWVGKEAPYPIYFSRARDGDRVNWQVEIEYEEGQALPPLPKSWKWTWYYFGNPQMFYTQTYRVERLRLNAALPLSRFERRLEPGLLVYDVARNRQFEVDEDGRLGPIRYEHAKQPWRLWAWLAVAVAGVVGLLFGWRRLQKRKQPGKLAP